MSWLFSQVLVEEYLGASYLAGEQSVQSSGKPTPQAYCAPDKMTEFSRLSRFGMTYKPLMEDRGEELLTLFREDFHAKTSVQQTQKPKELTENDQECGEKWHASFVKYDHDSFLWKTHQCSLAGDLEQFLETWPQWGLMRNGECWEQQTLAQTIRGTESGLLPNGIDSFHTPNTTGLDGGSNSRKALKLRQNSPPPPTDLAYANSTHEQRMQCTKRTQSEYSDIDGTSELANSQNKGDVWWNWLMGFTEEKYNNRGSQINGRREWWQVEPRLGRVADGVAARVDRLKAIGNGQVPLCAATAWRILTER